MESLIVPELSDDESVLAKHLTSEDMLGKVIRIHLELEQLLYLFSTYALTVPEHITKGRFSYSALVKICLATGLNRDFAAALAKFGKIRNSFAHQPNYSIETDIEVLHNSFTGKLKEELKFTFESEGTSWQAQRQNWAQMTTNQKFMCLAVCIYHSLRAELVSMVAAKKLERLHMQIGAAHFKEGQSTG